MRQFLTIDTSVWADRYGDATKGVKSFSTQAIANADGAYYSSLVGANAATTATVSNLSDGTYNLPCVLMQMIGSVPSNNWEFNYLISVTGGVGTFKYNFQNDYGQSSTKAQIITANPFLNITLNGALSIPAWNGSYGGVGVLFAATFISGAGSLNGVGLGFRGGSGGAQNGSDGEGTDNLTFPSKYYNSTAGNGGQGGGYATDSGHIEGGNSGGGGNLGNGNAGTTRNTGIGGAGGVGLSTQNCHTLTPGGGSGQGGQEWNSSTAANGVAGSGIWICVARIQNFSGGVTCQGINGNDNSTKSASGASAGGGFLGKGQQLDIPGINVAGATGGVCSGSFGGNGGNSAPGAAHIDYSGITTGGIDSSLDSIYADTSAVLGAFL